MSAPQPVPVALPQAIGYPAPPPQTLSVVSMVLGICGLTLVPMAGSIAAIITGSMARRREPYGRPFWLTGLITGWVGVGLAALFLVIFIGTFVVSILIPLITFGVISGTVGAGS